MKDMKITASNIYEEICKVAKEGDIANWCTDLYCKVTPETKNIVDRYEYRNQVETFVDQITRTLWYDIPFVYPLKKGGL